MKSTVLGPMDMTVAEALLKETKQILDQLGLAFFLRHGTCLGAIRDGAFIEWDDDLDIGSVFGLHGLTEKRAREAVEVFKERNFNVEVIDSELHLSIDLNKLGTQIDWTCYRIINDSIYQWPVIKIPASLHEDLKEIDFLGEKFHVPNPPEEYLRLKYGPNWMTPKKAGGFEQDVLDLMDDGSGTYGSRGSMKLANIYVAEDHSGSIKVLDLEGGSIEGAEVTLAATSVLTGLEKAMTNGDGFVYFTLPEEVSYVVAVRYQDDSGDHSEILYTEELAPDVHYIYQRDPENPSGRVNAL